MLNWNERRCELLRKLWAEGYSASQIAAKLGGVTRNAVIGKVTRLGLEKRKAALSTTLQAVNERLRRQAAITGKRAFADPSSETHRAANGFVSKIARHVPATSKPMRVPIEEPEPTANACTLFELTNNRCRFPLWPDCGPTGNLYCGALGADLQHGLAYCPFHTEKCLNLKVTNHGQTQAA